MAAGAVAYLVTTKIMMAKGKFPNGLGAAMRAKGVGPTELGRQAGYSKQNIDRWADQSRKLKPEVAQRLAPFVDATVYDLLLLPPDAMLPSAASITDVPQVSWISAGELRDQDAVDLSEAPTLPEPDLPAGQWIALKVDGPSMNKISPPDSTIFVNLKDKRLVANACYVIADETGAATYKRYRPNMKPPFQPASYEDVAAPKLEGAITIIGRVRRSKIDM